MFNQRLAVNIPSVAQSGSALALGARGREFESHHSDHFSVCIARTRFGYGALQSGNHKTPREDCGYGLTLNIGGRHEPGKVRALA